MHSINEALGKLAATQRRPDGRDYIETLERGLLGHSEDIGALSLLNVQDADLGDLAWAVASHHESRWSSEGVAQIVYEHSVSSRSRYTFPGVEAFCASANVTLPKRGSHSQFLAGFDDENAFRRRFAGAYFSFDHLLIEDPVPWIFGWDQIGVRFEGHDPVIDADRLTPHALQPSCRERLNRWLGFCRTFAADIRSGRIVPVTTLMPDWRFVYSGGRDSDKNKVGGFDRLEDIILAEFLIGEADIKRVAEAQNVGLAPQLPDMVVRDLFWQSHFCDTASAACRTPEEAGFVARHLFEHRQTLSPGRAVLNNFGSSVLLTGFHVDAAGLTFEEIRSIAQSEEAIALMRSTIRDCATTMSQTGQAGMLAEQAVCDAAIGELRETLLKKSVGNDWKGALFKPSTVAGLTFVGGAAGTAFASTDIKAIVGAGLGSVFPLFFTAKDVYSDVVKRRRADVSMKIVLSYITPPESP